MADVRARNLNQTENGDTDTVFSSANPVHQTGDLLLHIIANDTGTVEISATAGWTELLTQDRINGSRSAIFYKFAASSSEPDPDFTGSGDGWGVTAIAIPDADTSTIFEASAVNRTSDGDPATIISAVTLSSGATGADWAAGVVVVEIPNASTDVNPQNAYLEIQVTIASKKTTWPRNNIVIKKGTIA